MVCLWKLLKQGDFCFCYECSTWSWLTLHIYARRSKGLCELILNVSILYKSALSRVSEIKVALVEHVDTY